MKKKQATQNVNQPTKSTSLSNFNYISKPDDPIDTDPAMSAAQLEQRRSKEKQW